MNVQRLSRTGMSTDRRLAHLDKAIYSLKLESLIQQVFLECALCT